jgi:cysteine sulfinate desulfinase/cysteine desulfurase-like protein
VILPVRAASAILALLVAATAVGAEALGTADADGRAPVLAVVAGRSTDLVVLDGGHDRGFRPGTVCNVSRAGRAFGALVIAEAGLRRSVALILSLDESAAIAAGDLVTPRANPRI